MSTPAIRGIGLSLLLFVLRVGLADHSYDTFSADDLAAFTDSSDACSNFHDSLFLPFCLATRQKMRRIGICSLKTALDQLQMPQGARPSVRMSAPTSVTATVC